MFDRGWPADDRPWRIEDLLDGYAAARSRSRDATGAVRALLERMAELRLDLDDDGDVTSDLDASSGPAADWPADMSTTPAVPHHELLQLLGRGGFGEVWLARHQLLEHYRAVKLVARSSTIELEGLRRLKQRVPDHPGLLAIDDVGAVDGRLYVLMPLADDADAARPSFDPAHYAARTLDRERRRRGPLPAAEVIDVGRGLAAALQHLHEHGVVHGDVKPANVLRVDGRWMLADYGLVADAEQPAQRGWTPGYAPPEGPGGARADVYALGVVLRELLDRYALTDDDDASPHATPRDTDAVRRWALRAVIDRATADDPARRFATARALGAALDRLPKASGTANAPPSRGRRRAAVAALLAVIGTVAAFTISRPAAVPEDRAELVRSVRVTHIAFTDPDDLGDPGVVAAELGVERADVPHRDAIRVAVELSRPASCYLLTADTNGAVTLRWPDREDVSPAFVTDLDFPLSRTASYELSDGPGVQAIVLVASETALPPFASHRPQPRWRAHAATGGWLYDNAAFRPMHAADRGRIVERSGAPQPFVELITPLRTAAGAQVWGMTFDVVPRDP